MRKALGILALALSMTLVSCGDASGPGSLERVPALVSGEDAAPGGAAS